MKKMNIFSILMSRHQSPCLPTPQKMLFIYIILGQSSLEEQFAVLKKNFKAVDQRFDDNVKEIDQKADVSVSEFDQKF